MSFSAAAEVLLTKSWGDLLEVLCSTFFSMFAIFDKMQCLPQRAGGRQIAGIFSWCHKAVSWAQYRRKSVIEWASLPQLHYSTITDASAWRCSRGDGRDAIQSTCSFPARSA